MSRRWAAHLADDIDDIAVERLCAGTPPEDYTSHERREAALRLHQQGLTKRGIATRLRVDARQVYRDLDRFGRVNHREASG